MNMPRQGPDSRSEENGISAVFRNRNFALLWVSEVFGQSAQNAILFVLTVMMEGLTRSSALVGLMVLFNNLPSIMFGLLSGMVVDYWPKKSILLVCNLSRVFVVAAFIFFHRNALGGGLLFAVYFLTFLLSTVGQLSDPAEAAIVPLLVPPQQLLAANSMFYMLFNVAQVLGLLFLAPLSLTLGGVDGAFAIISLTYLITTALIWPISVSEPMRPATRDNPRMEKIVPFLSEQVRFGWQFIRKQRSVLIAISQNALINVLTTMIAILAPGFATRILGMQPKDAVYIFFSAGLGMFVITLWTGQAGYRFAREILIGAGLLVTGLALFGMAYVAWSVTLPASEAMILLTVFMAFLVGAGMTLTVVAAQTIVQERSPADIRGRVIAAQFVFTSLVNLPPTLFVGGLADIVGIAPVLVGLSVAVVAISLLSFWIHITKRDVSPC